MYKKYRFKKNFVTEEGEIHEGSEIVLMDNGIYFDGGLLSPAYYGIMMEIVNNPKLHREYLVEMVPNRDAYANNY